MISQDDKEDFWIYCKSNTLTKARIFFLFRESHLYFSAPNRGGKKKCHNFFFNERNFLVNFQSPRFFFLRSPVFFFFFTVQFWLKEHPPLRGAHFSQSKFFFSSSEKKKMISWKAMSEWFQRFFKKKNSPLYTHKTNLSYLKDFLQKWNE